MYAEDKKIVATVRSNGIAVLPGLLAEDELTEIRHQFDQAYLDTNKGPGEPGTRDSISGTALLHYEDPADPVRQAPTKEALEAGDSIPAVLKAGSVLFRVPEVWHAVLPIHHLRRYVTGSYAIRGRISQLMSEKIKAVSAQRAQTLDEIPSAFRTILSY